ncbi:hypothetical protein EGR_06881 [Echinococcus granulosus]|uniref:Uncharacterized protein n=1 Tax=Echinococcus granulosus TaxID=6210 RepID=W6UC79_ECHGR|nr:hypothetical protein EGR_06881 [Echinococcus granulosus]EUB58246.1 hypothetical protein EGR_06881 [Echinococcus granulosus]
MGQKEARISQKNILCLKSPVRRFVSCGWGTEAATPPHPYPLHGGCQLLLTALDNLHSVVWKSLKKQHFLYKICLNEAKERIYA